jgi:uncharacterized membrane protein
MRAADSKPLWQAISLGIIAGMRSMSSPALVSHLLSHHPSNALKGSPLRFIQTKVAANIFKALAAGEALGDKLPSAPDRTAPAVLAGRILAGGLAGGSIYKASGKNAIVGALIGGAAAVASTYAFFYLRTAIVKKSHIKDTYIALAEDALVAGSGLTVLKLS